METVPTPEKGPLGLRRASEADIPALIELGKRVAGKKTFSPNLEHGEWEEELKHTAVYLIEVGGAIVGHVEYERKEPGHAYISGLVVDPNYQGKGYAREALSRVINELSDCSRIDLVTHPENTEALGLYESLGFEVEERKEDHYGDGEPRLVLALKRG